MFERDCMKRSLILSSLLLLTTAACMRTNPGGVPIQIAPKSPDSLALEKCAKGRVSQQFALRELPSRKVCRLVEDDGAKLIAKDVEITPRYMLRSKGGRLQLAMRVGVGVEALLSKPEDEARFVSFLGSVCGPRIVSIFERSELSVRFLFAPYRRGDPIASKAPDARETPVVRRGVNPAKEKIEAELSPLAVSDAVPGGAVHTILLFEPKGDGGFGLSDQVDALSSGRPPEGGKYKAGSAEETALLGFCAQIASRLTEGFGMTTGQTCADQAARVKTMAEEKIQREKVAAEKAAAEKLEAEKAAEVEKAGGKPEKSKIRVKSIVAETGLRKAHDLGELFGKGRINSAERAEITEPICGAKPAN